MSDPSLPIVDREKKVIAAITEENGTINYWEAEAQPIERNSLEDVFVLIPARGGSKIIPRKNLQKIHGISLLARSIQVCKSVFPVNNIIVSTDDPEIAKEARSYGLHIPWLRPASLSTDTAKSYDVVLYTIEKLLQNNINLYIFL